MMGEFYCCYYNFQQTANDPRKQEVFLFLHCSYFHEMNDQCRNVVYQHISGGGSSSGKEIKEKKNKSYDYYLPHFLLFLFSLCLLLSDAIYLFLRNKIIIVTRPKSVCVCVTHMENKPWIKQK